MDIDVKYNAGAILGLEIPLAGEKKKLDDTVPHSASKVMHHRIPPQRRCGRSTMTSRRDSQFRGSYGGQLNPLHGTPNHRVTLAAIRPLTKSDPMPQYPRDQRSPMLGATPTNLQKVLGHRRANLTSGVNFIAMGMAY